MTSVNTRHKATSNRPTTASREHRQQLGSGQQRTEESNSKDRTMLRQIGSLPFGRTSFVVPFITSQNRPLLLRGRRMPAHRINELTSSSSVTLMYSTDMHIATTSPVSAEVLSTQDIVVGTILAFILAFSYSYLNGQSSSSSFVSWQSQLDRDINASASTSISSSSDITGEEKVFNSENWKEMSREENYVLYNTRIRQKTSQQTTNRRNKTNNTLQQRENKLVLIALLVLFVPIFSVEFFFALSRQFLCEGSFFSGGEVAQKLCSPILGR